MMCGLAHFVLEGIGMKKKWKCFTVYILTLSMVFSWVITPNTVMGSVKKQGGLDTVYLTSSMNFPTPGDGSTKERPLKDINKAFALVNDGGTIVIVDNYVHQGKLTTPEDKMLTVKGETSSVFMSLRYGLAQGNDLKFDSIRLETPSTEADGRCFYANGYSLTMTDSVQCFTNQNVNQKAYIYAGSPDGSEISGRRAVIDVAGGNFAGIYGYGKGRAKVADGSEITIRSNADTDQLDTALVLNLYSRQKLLGSIQNVDQLNITYPVSVYTLINVKNVSLSSTLTLTTENGTTLTGDMDLNGSAVLNIDADLHVKGRISGYAQVLASLGRQIISDVPGSAGILELNNSQLPWEIRTTVTGTNKIWRVEKKSSKSIYYINGKDGDDSNTGQSEDQAFASLSKALQAASTGRENIVFKIVGDTQVDKALVLSLPGHSIEVSGNKSAPAKLTFTQPLTIKDFTQIHDLKLDFSACSGRDGVIIKGVGVSFENNLTMEGTPPDIRYESVPDSQDTQQMDILSGSYGTIKDENKEGILILHNGDIQGKVLGWQMLDLAPDSQQNEEIVIHGGIEGTEDLYIYSLDDAAKVNGDIQVSNMDTDGGDANLVMTSGKKITAEIFSTQISLTILPENGTIEEGVYLTADTLSDDTITRIVLIDTDGHLMKVEKDGSKYTGILKKVPQLKAPVNVRWDEQGNGKLQWDKVPNADSYIIELFEEGQYLTTVKNIKTETYDCSQYFNGKGTYQAKISAVDSSNQYSDSQKTDSGLLSYRPKAKSVILGGGDRQMIVGDTIHIRSRVLPDDADDRLIWKSSNESSAIVDDKGSVTAVSEGTAEITATAADGSGVSASAKITVSNKVQKVQSIRLNQTTKDLYPGDSFVLQADVQPQSADDKSVSWSSNSKAVSVNSSGRVTALAEGTAKVTAKARDGSKAEASCDITVKRKIYRVQYVMNGGRNHPGNPSAYTAVPVRLKAPERSGYLFAGWYTDAGFHSRIETLTQKKDYQLYAKWQKISLKVPKVTSLKKTVGTTLSVSYTRVQGAAGYEVSVSSDSGFRLPDTKKWITSAVQKNAGGLKKNMQYYTRIRAYRLDSAGKRVYGPYSAKTKGYTIKYKLNRGKNSSANLVSYYNVSVRLNNPVRKGYRFKGWYTSKKYKKRIKTISKGKRSNYTLYAKWKKK